MPDKTLAIRSGVLEKGMRLRKFTFMASCFLTACGTAQPELETVPLTVITSDRNHELIVELANDPQEIEMGLMGREDIGRHDGMLFVSNVPRTPRFWMKNTRIPLDMIFIDEDEDVVLIAADRRPGDLTYVTPDRPVVAVLELEAGKSAQMGLREGDKVILPDY